MTSNIFVWSSLLRASFLYTKAVSKLEGPKNFPGALFSVSFSQPPAVNKDTENSAPGKFFMGPTYFVTALTTTLSESFFSKPTFRFLQK